MRRILLILALTAASCMAAALYFDVSPDSHFVVTNRAGDTLWKSSAAATDSLLAAWGILGAPVWLKTGDSIKVDSGTVGTWGDLRWLGLLGKAADATGADSADVGVVSRSCTGNAATADSSKGGATRATLAAQATVADSSTGGATRATTAQSLQGQDTTALWDAKTLQGKDTTALFAAKTATKIASDGDSAKVWTMTSPTTQGWLTASGGGGDSTWLFGAFTDSVTSGKFIGPLTGNVTGDVNGSSGSCTGNAATATLADSTIAIPDAITGTSVTITGRDSAAAQKGDTIIGRVKTAFIQPPADSVQALQIFKANGTTSIFNVDSRNERVGIGTTTPIAALDVNGDIKLSGASYRYIYGPIGAYDLGLVSEQNLNFYANSFTPLRIRKGTVASNTVGQCLNFGAADDADLGFFVDRSAATTWRARGSGAAANPTLIRSTGGRIIFYADTNKTDLGTYTPTERMRIDCNGQVSICTTAARSTEKLFVKGNILSSGQVGMSAFALGAAIWDSITYAADTSEMYIWTRGKKGTVTLAAP